MNKNTALVVIVIMFGGCSFACRQREPVRTIHVDSTLRGWVQKQSSFDVKHSNGRYWSGNIEIPESAVQRLVAAVRAPAIKKFDEQNLGITRQWLNETARLAVKQYEAQYHKLDKRRENLLISYIKRPSVLQTAILVNSRTDYSPAIRVELEFENGDRMQVMSGSQNPFMVPWLVTHQGSTARTFNADISRALFNLVPVDFVNKGQLSGNDMRGDVIFSVLRNGPVMTW